MLLAREQTNVGRQKEFDIVKALAIVFMVIVHCYEMIFPCPEALCSTPFETIIEFLGGPLAAPVFMFSMGLGMVYTKHNSPKELFFRGLKLFGFSYLFNVIRFVIPKTIGGYAIYTYPFLAFHIDILTFAGVAFMLTALFKKIKLPVWGIVITAIVMQAVGTILGYYLPVEKEGLNYLTGIVYSSCEATYFPALIWYIYPALGILFGTYLKRTENKDKLYLIVLLIASAVLFSLITTLSYLKFDIRRLFSIYDNTYYKQTVAHVLFTGCCILIELSLVHFASKVIKIPALDRFFKFMSSNLNLIYIMQWLIIGYISAADILVSGRAMIVIGLYVVALSAGLAYIVNKIKRRLKHD